jgi:hypothetical protein
MNPNGPHGPHSGAAKVAIPRVAEAIAKIDVDGDSTLGVVWIDLAFESGEHRWIALKPTDALMFSAKIAETAFALEPAARVRLDKRAEQDFIDNLRKTRPS